MQISKEVKTGILVLLGILLFIFGFNYLKGENLLSNSRTFYTVYDNVEGLTASTPVTINGLIVGKVVEINFNNDDSGKLLVKLLIDTDFQFSKNSKAELYETGLIGGKAIAIVPVFDNAEIAKNESYLAGTVKAGLSELVNQKLTPLQEKLVTMLDSADKLLVNMNDVFDANTKANLRGSIAGFNERILEFKKTTQSLNILLASDNSKLNKSLAHVENITSNLSKVSDSIADANFSKTLKSLESTLQNFDKIVAGLEKGEGSMGKLLKDEALYNNLKGTTKEMEELLRDIKLHPKRYFRILSKKEIPYTEDTK